MDSDRCLECEALRAEVNALGARALRCLAEVGRLSDEVGHLRRRLAEIGKALDGRRMFVMEHVDGTFTVHDR